MKKNDDELTFPERATRRLRIAAYPDIELLDKLDNWCAMRNFDRNAGLRAILRTMLNVYDDGIDTTLYHRIASIETTVKNLEESKAFC